MTFLSSLPSPRGLGGAIFLALSLVLLTPTTAVSAAADSDPAPEMSPTHRHDAAAETYVCPMHPQIVRHAPGSCPICGMDLVKKVLAPTDSPDPEVRLAPGVVQALSLIHISQGIVR